MRNAFVLTIFCTAAVLSATVPALAQRRPIDGTSVTNGDFNRDGYFDMLDLRQIERAVVVRTPANQKELEAADVDGDGELTGFDLLVLTDAMGKVEKQGMSMFDAVKESIEDDLAKSGDNVETYLDLARFYSKEDMQTRARSVLESMVEAMDTRHPLYGEITSTLEEIKQKELRAMSDEEEYLESDIYTTEADITGKSGLRSQVVKLRGQLSDLLKDQQFAAHYNNKRVKSRLGDVMDEMLRKINDDQSISPGAFDNFGGELRGILEDPGNMVKPLSSGQKNKISQVIEQSSNRMKNEAVELQNAAEGRRRQADENLPQAPAAGPESRGMSMILNRDSDRVQTAGSENMDMDHLIVANSPDLEPDTISLVKPTYDINWDVSNVLGAKNACLEISKPDRRFTNPNGIRPDQDNTYFFAPSLSGINGQRRGSATELEGVGTYYYRVAAIDSKGEFMSRFSDAVPLIVVYNNVDTKAKKPEVDPPRITPRNPDYILRWDVSNIEGARDVAVEISKPGMVFDNPNGSKRDRTNTYFFNPSLGRMIGSFSSSIAGLDGPGVYLFRVIGVSPYGDFVGRWSDPDTLTILESGQEQQQQPEPVTPPEMEPPEPPRIQSPSREGFRLTWDVSSREQATGVSYELIKSAPDTSDPGRGAGPSSAGRGQVVKRGQVNRTSGSLQVGSGELDGPGNYFARVAAVDADGNALGPWSSGARLRVDSSGEILTGEAAERPAGDEDSPEPQEIPDGETLIVTDENIPLYEKNTISSDELLTLKKGDKLILRDEGSDGTWYHVYYPLKGKDGWVLDFNVQRAGEQQ